jgi:phosphoribosyl 1,2-cyclic phosphate phosphodiesterase
LKANLLESDIFVNEMPSLKITFLGTGTSQGVPVIGCTCKVCASSDFRDKRLRTSLMFESEGQVFVIDTGPDFRQQMLREQVKRLDAVLFTHEHKDHLGGLDDVRAFNYLSKRALTVFATDEVQAAIRRDFHYVFTDEKYPGVPDLDLREMPSATFRLGSLNILPIQVWHHRMPVTAFRIGDFTYITDANRIDAQELEKIKGSKIIVINALRREPHISHFTLQQALELLKFLAPEKAYLTHLSHQIGTHEEVSAELPAGVEVAYDRLKLSL